MPEPVLLSQFFRKYGHSAKEDFLKVFKGAFLLVRSQGGQPLVYFLDDKVETRTVLGADEECTLDFDDPTMDAEHAVITFHTGFRGWTIEDLDTNFGTHVDGDRIQKGKPTLLRDQVIIKPGGGLTELQFYTAEALFKRMNKAGITRSLRQQKKKPN